MSSHMRYPSSSREKVEDFLTLVFESLFFSLILESLLLPFAELVTALDLPANYYYLTCSNIASLVLVAASAVCLVYFWSSKFFGMEFRDPIFPPIIPLDAFEESPMTLFLKPSACLEFDIINFDG